MAISIAQINSLISWYLTAEPGDRLDSLIKGAPVDMEKGTMDRAALRRVYTILESVTVSRNKLLEEFASDVWRAAQLTLEFNQEQRC